MATSAQQLSLRDVLYILIGITVSLSAYKIIYWATGFFPHLFPFLSGLVGGVLGMLLARRMRRR
jgi:hypothetical protein